MSKRASRKHGEIKWLLCTAVSIWLRSGKKSCIFKLQYRRQFLIRVQLQVSFPSLFRGDLEMSCARGSANFYWLKMYLSSRIHQSWSIISRETSLYVLSFLRGPGGHCTATVTWINVTWCSTVTVNHIIQAGKCCKTFLDSAFFSCSQWYKKKSLKLLLVCYFTRH